MTEQEKLALFDRSAKFYGLMRELIVLMEECAELIQAVSKHLRYGDRSGELGEEIADVLLMIDKIMHLFGETFRAGVMACYEAKLERLRRRVDEGENREILNG